MPAAGCRMLTLLCALVRARPIGTNLGRLHLLWRLARGRLLASRGAVIPGLSDCGLSARAIRRAWAALGQGGWTSAQLLARRAATVAAAGHRQPHAHGGHRPAGVDVTGCWRPRQGKCPTTHYHSEAGKALPAIPVGRAARVGSAAGRRLALPLAFVRAAPADPTPAAHARRLVRAAVRQRATAAALVLEAGFSLTLRQAEGARRYVVRVAKNSTFRRATPPASGGRPRPPPRGAVVRPLPRPCRGRPIPATAPAQRATGQEGGALRRAAVWADLVLPDAGAAAPTFAVVAVHDPRHREPLLRASPLPVAPRVLRDLYRDRWPVEQVPRAARQMVGAARQFVHAPETCPRLPALALRAGRVLSHVAATAPAIPTGFGDRRPQPTPGRLRRSLARRPFPQDFPLPARIRAKAAVTAHLPTGFWGQRQRPQVIAAPVGNLAEAA
jgi:hypothetical protein